MGCTDSKSGSSGEWNGNPEAELSISVASVRNGNVTRSNENATSKKSEEDARETFVETYLNGGVVVREEVKHHDKTGEEPVVELPVGDFGDFKLGLTPKEVIESAFERDNLFCDPDFPADNQALFYSNKSEKDVVWLRPKELLLEGKIPHLLVDGVSRDDIKQGKLGDCWFLSSCAAVSQRQTFMRKIIPNDYPLCGEGYKGIVHFRLFRFGEWVDVYVDDRLPTVDGKLIYAHCEDETEFWVALLEKAYAKLHGSYEAIEGGQTMDALVDLTGGLAERYELRKNDPYMYRHILRAHNAGSFVACSRKGDWRQSSVADANGLVSGHAYTVTGIEKVKHKMGQEKLLRIRNPWGDGAEWKGSWSDDDSNWDWLDEETKQKLNFAQKADGEFWMSFKDFCQHFQEVTICTIGPDFDGGISQGHVEMVRGEWYTGESAGGSRNNLELFATNPQYLVTLHEPDDFDPRTDDPENEGKCSVVITLMQEHRRSKRHLGVKTLQISFVLYATDDPSSRLPVEHFQRHYETGKSGVYINYRQVSGRFDLEPAHYILIPSTFNPGETGTFLIRAFAQKKFSIQGPL